MSRRKFRQFLASDLALLLGIALVRVILHLLTNNNAGFHRDELNTIALARRLAWGYTEYPPLTPFLTRVSLVLFGESGVSVRLFSVLAQGVAIVVAGLMAGEMGGRRGAKALAAMAVAVSSVSVAMGTLMMYVSFDFLWWLLAAYFTVKIIHTEDPRWWLGVGAAIGLGAMTRYTIVIAVPALAVGFLLTRARRYLLSWWLLAGVGVAALVCLPNFIWQAQHGFIALEFTSAIHRRDILWGRTQAFFVDQVKEASNPLTVPLWIVGLYYYFLTPLGRRYAALGWMAVSAFVLFYISQGRGYYTGPIYPILTTGGAVAVQELVARLKPRAARAIWATAYTLVVIGGVGALALDLPVAPEGSAYWRFTSSIIGDQIEKVGWPELAGEVARIYGGLPEADRAKTAILTANYGEAGAIDLYGRALGLPRPISGTNTFWDRGYGDPPPEHVILLGFGGGWASGAFRDCKSAGWVPNPYTVDNEESRSPVIYYCGAPRQSWAQFWDKFRSFG
jgi:hypothetical protein